MVPRTATQRLASFVASTCVSLLVACAPAKQATQLPPRAPVADGSAPALVNRPKSSDGDPGRPKAGFTAARYTLSTVGTYMDGCSQTTIFGTRYGQFFVETRASGEVVAGLQIEARERSGPSPGQSGEFKQHTWLRTWLYVGQMRTQERGGQGFEVALEPAQGDACQLERPTQWRPYESAATSNDVCSEADRPMRLRCQTVRQELPAAAQHPSRRSPAARRSTVELISCEVAGTWPHHDVVAPGDRLVAAERSGLELRNDHDDTLLGTGQEPSLTFTPQTSVGAP